MENHIYNFNNNTEFNYNIETRTNRWNTCI